MSKNNGKHRREYFKVPGNPCIQDRCQDNERCRYSVGVLPYQRLNAREKLAGSVNPSRKAISLNECCGSRTYCIPQFAPRAFHQLGERHALILELALQATLTDVDG